MAGFVDLLKLIVDADTKGAVSAFNKLENEAGSSLKGVEKKTADSFDGVEQKATSFTGKVKGSFSNLAGGMAASLGPAAIAASVGAGIGLAINAASNLNEQVSKTKSVFGESADGILKWSDTAATSLGQSKTQALEAVSSFGNLFQQLGLTGQAVTDMSTKMVGLASDFGSFFNTDPATALEAISAAFRGEYDAVQKFVPTINAAAVEQEALKEGLANTTSELTQQDKAVATYNLLLHGAGKATGDFAKTSDSLANQQRILKAQVADAAAALGEQLLPALAKLAGYASKAIEIVVDIKQKTGGDKSPFFMDLPHLISTAWEGITTGKPPWKLFSEQVDDAAKKSTNSVMLANGAIATVGMTAQFAAQLTAESNARAADSFGTFEQRAHGVGNAMEEQATSIKKAEDALRSHTNAVLEATGSALGVSAAQRDFNASIASTDELLKTGKASADDLAASYDAQTQAAIDTASATATFAQKQAELHGKTLTASESNDIMIGTLYGLAGQMNGPSKDAVVGLIGQLQDLGKQNPKPTASVNDQASGPLADIRGKVDGLGSRAATITVTANVTAARNAVNGLINGLNRIPGTNIAPIAKGTKDFAGGLALVGELGPELVYLPQHSAVKTAAETKKIMDGPTPMALASGSGSASNVIQITVNGAVDPYNTARQIQTILAKGARGGFSTLAA